MPAYYGKKVALLFVVNLIFYLQNLLLLPLLSRILGVEIYGIWGQVTATVSFLMPVALLGLPDAFTRFSANLSDSAQIATNYYTMLVLVFVSGCGVALMLLCLATQMSHYFLHEVTGVTVYFRLAAGLLFTQALGQCVLSYFRTFQHVAVLSLLRILQPVSSVGLALILLSTGHGLIAVILAFIATNTTIFVCTQLCITRAIGISCPDIARIRPFLAFGLPFVPASLLSWITGLSDRYVIGAFMSVTDLGVYSACYTLGMVVMFFYAPFRVFIRPRSMQLWDCGKEDTLKRLLYYSNKYPLLLSVGALTGALALHDSIMSLMTGRVLSVSSLLIPIIGLGYLFLYIGTAYGIVFEFVKQTHYVIRGYALAAALNILGNLLLIPYFGIFGAAVSTALAYLCFMLFMIYKSSKYFFLGLKWNYLWKAILAAIVMYLVLLCVRPRPGEIRELAQLAIAVTAGFIVYGGIVWSLGGICSEEVAYVRRLFKSRR